MSQRTAYLLALVAWIGLVILTIAWEGWLAPAWGWLVIKSILLLVPLFGMLHGKRGHFTVAALLSMLFIIEGIVVSWTGYSVAGHDIAVRTCAALEILLVLAFYAATYRFLSSTRKA